MSKKVKLALWLGAAVVVAALIVTWLFMTDKILWRKGSLLEIYNADDLTISEINYTGTVATVSPVDSDMMIYGWYFDNEDEIEAFREKFLELDWQPVRSLGEWDTELSYIDFRVLFEENEDYSISIGIRSGNTISVSVGGTMIPSYRSRSGYYTVEGGFDVDYILEVVNGRRP